MGDIKDGVRRMFQADKTATLVIEEREREREKESEKVFPMAQLFSMFSLLFLCDLSNTTLSIDYLS